MIYKLFHEPKQIAIAKYNSQKLDTQHQGIIEASFC